MIWLETRTSSVCSAWEISAGEADAPRGDNQVACTWPARPDEIHRVAAGTERDGIHRVAAGWVSRDT